MIAGLLCATAACAQFGTELLPNTEVGRPPQALFITFLGIGNFGKFPTDPSWPLVGPVAQTVYEELRAYETPAGPAGQVVNSITSVRDEAGRVIEEVNKKYGPESDTIHRYDGDRLVSQETTFRNSKQFQPKSWNYWVYDKSGKVIEFRKGRGDEIENHTTNFKRDAQGRLTGYDDMKHTKTTSYSGDEGSLAYTVTTDTRGATVGVAGGANGKDLGAEVHCTGDSHGNWIECQLITKNGGGEKVSKMWRRKITYR